MPGCCRSRRPVTRSRPAPGICVVPAILAHTEPRWQLQADRLAAEALAADDPTGWFERLYGAAEHGAVTMPWDRDTPNPVAGAVGAGDRT